MLQVYKYKLQPGRKQSLALQRTLNACRDIWNLSLEPKMHRIIAFAQMRELQQVHDAGWNQVTSLVSYKAEEAGRRVVEVDCRYTSQECPTCGTVTKKLVSQPSHECEECGLVLHRDTAPAQVILGRMVSSGENLGKVMPCVA